jgi:elongation factor 1 alpha-like protein
MMILITNHVAALSKSAKTPSKTAAEKKADQISNGIEAMKIDETPRATSKNLDVLAEYEKKKSKNSANFIVIGMAPKRRLA